MGRFPRLTPVRLGPQVPDLTTVSKPDVSMLRVWGCTAYVLVQKDKRPLGSLWIAHGEVYLHWIPRWL